jgi:EAL domain-containing protein (putative c-di-GMP-specific phosphodiesterase class I)
MWRQCRTGGLPAGSTQLLPFYQPKLCLKTGKVVGLEALLRWCVTPNFFQS